MKYYSETLKRLFETADECAQAEAAQERAKAEAEAKKKALAEGRTNRAKEVEELYKAAVEAKKAYNKALDAFVKDYGSFHFSVREPSTSLSSVFDLFF